MLNPRASKTYLIRIQGDRGGQRIALNVIRLAAQQLVAERYLLQFC